MRLTLAIIQAKVFWLEKKMMTRKTLTKMGWPASF
jgi:hypothetical protein